MADEIISYPVTNSFTNYVNGQLYEYRHGDVISVDEAANFCNISTLKWSYITPNKVPAPSFEGVR